VGVELLTSSQSPLANLGIILYLLENN